MNGVVFQISATMMMKMAGHCRVRGALPAGKRLASYPVPGVQAYCQL
jgi:hypothetical protein